MLTSESSNLRSEIGIQSENWDSLLRIWLDGITDSMDMSLRSSRSWWWTGKPGVLQSLGLQRVGHNWATGLNWIWEHRRAFPFAFICLFLALLGLFLLCRLSSSCGRWEGCSSCSCSASHCGGFSHCRAWAPPLFQLLTAVASPTAEPGLHFCSGFSLRRRLSLQRLLSLQSLGSRRTGFGSCSSRALEHSLSSCSSQA